MTRDERTRIAIIGGGLGGTAAALALPATPHIMTEATDWPGGQITSQGVAALDEHDHIERFGGTRGYIALRDAIRAHYQRDYDAPAIMKNSVLGPDMPLNPGNGWVSRLCFDPRVALAYLQQQLAAAPDTRLLLRTTPISAALVGDRVQSVMLRDADGHDIRLHAEVFLEATELGDLLPLTGTPYITGAEAAADTGEDGAPAVARPTETQGFTFCFAVAYHPGEDHTISPPPGYERFRAQQPYTLAPIGRDGQPVVFNVFRTSEQGNPPFWTYRRIHDGDLLGGHDISLINWVSNDYHGRGIIDVTPAERDAALDEARRLALGFLYWLQTECPRDDGGQGYPEFKLRPDVMGTADGLAKAPYIREARRIVPLQRITAQDVSADRHPGARAPHVRDSVGVGWYALDLHPCVGNPRASLYAPTRPFQLPLGALIPRGRDNLIAAAKTIGTTHLTNGAYRVHPVEWAIGEAAATLARFCVDHGVLPQQVHSDAWLVWQLQYRLVRRGCPIFWALDVPPAHPLFVPTQLLLVRGLIVPDSPRAHTLEIGLDQSLGDGIDLEGLRRIATDLNTRARRPLVDEAGLRPDQSWAQVCAAFRPALEAVLTG